MRRSVSRLTIMTLTAGLAIGGVSGWLIYAHAQMHQQLARQRDQAIRAVHRGWYPPAAASLRSYLQQTAQPDAEALYALAIATRHIPTPDGAHRLAAMQLLREAVRLAPEHQSAKQALLELYGELQFDLEAVALAEHMPPRPDVLRVKAEALARLERFDAALTTARQCAAAAPTDPAAHLLILDILLRGPWPPEQAVAHAQTLKQQHPVDPRFDPLLAHAFRRAGREAEAIQLLHRIPAHAMPDPLGIRLLVREQEAAGLFTEALAALAEAADRFDDPWIARSLACRRWQRQQVETLLEQLTSLDPASLDTDTELLALKAMALVQVGQTAEMDAVVDALRRRPHDPSAEAWVIYLAGVFTQHLGPDAAIRRCRQALTLDPTNPYIQFALGGWLEQQGDLTGALEAWSIAAAQRPAWAQPRLRMAQTLAQLRLGHQAVRMAASAKRRMPDALEVDIVMALAHAAERQAQNTRETASLLAQVDAIQKRQPGEPQTLPLYVALLAEVGRREDAAETLLAALDQAPTPATLIQLAAVSQAHRLGLSAACYAQCRMLHGPSPQLAYAQAMTLWTQGQPREALAALSLPSSSGPTADPLPAKVQRSWQLAHASFLDRIGAPEARHAWQQLARQFPHDLQVQRRLLEARSTRSDLALTRQAVDQLRALGGAHSLDWRIADARWRLNTPDATEADLAAAALRLGEVVRRVPMLIEPRLLLAACFERMGNRSGAISQLRQAHADAPASRPVALELARLLSDSDRAHQLESLALVEQVLANPAASADQLQQAALLLIQLREWDKAAAALTRAVSADGSRLEKLTFSEDPSQYDALAPAPLPSAIGPRGIPPKKDGPP